MRKIILAAVLAAAALPVQATVVYRWETFRESASIVDASGRIEISDAAYRAGGLVFPPDEIPILNGELDCPGSGGGGCYAYTNPAIERFVFSAVGGREVITTDYGARNFATSAEFNATLSRLGDSLAGSFNVIDGRSRWIWSSIPDSEGAWILEALASDNPSEPCRGPLTGENATPCGGLIGRFVLDESTIPGEVPIPAPLALMAVAGLGLVVSRKKSGRSTC